VNAVMILLFLSFGVGDLAHDEPLVKELTANIKVHSQEIAIDYIDSKAKNLKGSYL
jgi:hypothetical protein